MMNNDFTQYGLLLNGNNIKLHRLWFKQMTEMIGIKVGYRAPKKDKHYTTYAEIDTNFEKIEVVGCIFEEHPDQKTLKKLGWAAELQENESIIHVPYDLNGIQVGAVFLIPSALDNTRGRVFRVTELSTIMIYPASIACKIVPEYEDVYTGAQDTYKHSSFNLLYQED